MEMVERLPVVYCSHTCVDKKNWQHVHYIGAYSSKNKMSKWLVDIVCDQLAEAFNTNISQHPMRAIQGIKVGFFLQ